MPLRGVNFRRSDNSERYDDRRKTAVLFPWAWDILGQEKKRAVSLKSAFIRVTTARVEKFILCVLDLPPTPLSRCEIDVATCNPTATTISNAETILETASQANALHVGNFRARSVHGTQNILYTVDGT